MPDAEDVGGLHEKQEESDDDEESKQLAALVDTLAARETSNIFPSVLPENTGSAAKASAAKDILNIVRTFEGETMKRPGLCFVLFFKLMKPYIENKLQ